MNAKEIIDQILAPYAEFVGISDIEPTHSLDDLQIDSLDRVEVVMELEKQLQITIPDSEIEKLNTVQQLIDYLEKVSSSTGAQS